MSRYAGQRCEQLLIRIDPETVGAVETKCQACNKTQVIVLSGMREPA